MGEVPPAPAAVVLAEAVGADGLLLLTDALKVVEGRAGTRLVDESGTRRVA